MWECQYWGSLLIYIHSRMTVLNSVILLQIVMMSPGTHLVKNHESQSIKYIPSTYLKHKKDYNKYASLNNCHRNHTNRIFYQKSSNQSIVFCVLHDACHELFCVFGDFYASGTHDAEVTKSLLNEGDFNVRSPN